MATATDPLSLVYVALWDMLEAHSGLTDLIRTGNRVKYAGFLQVPRKDIVQNADVPEVGITPTGSLFGLQITSNSTRIVERYDAGLLTGTSQLSETGTFLPIKWELLRAFTGWEAALRALTWESKMFVKLLKLTDIVDILLDVKEAKDRGIAGWTSLLRFEVTMMFATADMQPS